MTLASPLSCDYQATLNTCHQVTTVLYADITNRFRHFSPWNQIWPQTLLAAKWPPLSSQLASLTSLPRLGSSTSSVWLNLLTFEDNLFFLKCHACSVIFLLSSLPRPPFLCFLLIYFKNIYFWFCRVLVAAHRIFSFGMWNLVPRPGVEPGPLNQDHKVPAVRPPGKSLFFFFKKLIILVGGLLYNIVVVFAVHQHESATVHTSSFISTVCFCFPSFPIPFTHCHFPQPICLLRPSNALHR